VEAATSVQSEQARGLSGDKASLIVETMRISVATRGIAASTFDHVAREAGVSRGLLHYYFGTKERLLVEVVRRESDVRIEQLERRMAGASSADDVLAAMIQSFEDFLREPGGQVAMFYEIMTLAQRNGDIAAEVAELGRRTRGHLAKALRAKVQDGTLRLRDDADVVATFLFALADGVMVRHLTEPELNIGPVIGHVVAAARALLS
jgi:AcrR family transcriptional regulator